MAVPVDAPYDRLQALPRGTWLPALVCSAGARGQRLHDVRAWLDRLAAGDLPAAQADFGDADATRPLREVVAELGLPALSRGTPALAEQIVRSVLWQLDRLVDLQPRLSRTQAIADCVADFRAAWTHQTQGLDEDLALLRDLGDFGALQWDTLQGRLRSRPWQAARRAADRLQQLPELAALVRRLGRREVAVERLPAPAAQPKAASERVPLAPVETRLPDAPGETTGVRFTSRPERMLASEAVMLRHPTLRKLWRARHAEARLLGWDSEAVLVDWRADPLRTRRTAVATAPERLERGPMLLALDTSGSMRGAPENIAKAVVIAALRAAHEAGRGCRLIAFGAHGEVVEHDLGRGDDGLDALLALMGQSFDGGTDVQTPVERAIAAVHEARWAGADLLVVSDGEFGCVPQTLHQLDDARARHGLRVQGVLVGDRETMGLLDLCDDIHWVRDWRRHDDGGGTGHSPVHSKSLTALYFPNALSPRAARRPAR
jgi:uncharacterized protein with von Willebrand factor type A (vWA) domain